MWDASVVWSPTKTFEFAAIAVLPAYGIARVIRGMYMWHYRYILDRLDEDEPTTPLLLSPVRLYQTLATFFAVNARSVDVGTVYLIRIYFVLISSLVLIVIARHQAQALQRCGAPAASATGPIAARLPPRGAMLARADTQPRPTDRRDGVRAGTRLGQDPPRHLPPRGDVGGGGRG